MDLDVACWFIKNLVYDVMRMSGTHGWKDLASDFPRPLCGSWGAPPTQGSPPPLPLSCTVYQITQDQMETQDQMISDSFFYLPYIWEVEDTLRTEFARNFQWDARQFRY